MDKKLKWTCLLGHTESQRYTFYATDIEDLKERISDTWPEIYKGQWYEVTKAGDTPSESRRFKVKGKYGTAKACIWQEQNEEISKV